MDEDVELPQPSLQRVQRECAPDPGTADPGSQQDEQLDAVVFATELSSERQRAHHGN